MLAVFQELEQLINELTYSFSGMLVRWMICTPMLSWQPFSRPIPKMWSQEVCIFFLNFVFVMNWIFCIEVQFLCWIESAKSRIWYFCLGLTDAEKLTNAKFDESYFQDCMLELLSDMFGDESVNNDVSYSSPKSMSITIDKKVVNIDLVSLVSNPLLAFCLTCLWVSTMNKPQRM